MAAAVKIENLVRPSVTDMYAGERWRITITGAASNKQVSVETRYNNGAPSETVYGNTDASGNWSMEGTFGKDDFGLWTEIWKVDGIQVPPTIQFRVYIQGMVPSVAPVQIPEGLWTTGFSNTPMPDGTFVDDEGLIKGVVNQILLGWAYPEYWAIPWNLSSSSVGPGLPARRRVYAL